MILTIFFLSNFLLGKLKHVSDFKKIIDFGMEYKVKQVYLLQIATVL